MRKVVPFLGLLFLAAAPVFVMAQVKRCGYTEYLDRKKMEDPSLGLRLIQQEEVIRKAMVDQANSRTTSTITTIPVVFHVLYRTSGQNISTSRLADQLAVLNADFARLNADTGNTPSAFQARSAASNIQFCFAQRDPSGNWTNGIIRKVVTASGFDPLTNDNVKYSSLGGDDAWPSTDYLNIWVCNFSGASAGLLGISQMPNMGIPATDGCVVLYSTVGGPSFPGTMIDFNHGRTLTHEVGHWLALHHTWGDDFNACSGTDYVTDTPNQADENYGCPTFPVTDACSPSSPGVVFMNYMDYVNDDCMNMFTSGQVSRLHSALSVLRTSIMSSGGCLAPVGLAEISASSLFSISPNPFSGQTLLTASWDIPADISVIVDNAMGQRIFRTDLKNVTLLTQSLDLTSQAPGIYLVTLRTPERTETRRIVLTGY